RRSLLPIRRRPTGAESGPYSPDRWNEAVSYASTTTSATSPSTSPATLSECPTHPGKSLGVSSSQLTSVRCDPPLCTLLTPQWSNHTSAEIQRRTSFERPKSYSTKRGVSGSLPFH